MIKDTPQGQTHHCASCEELQLVNTGLLLNLEAQRIEAKELTAKVTKLERNNALMFECLDSIATNFRITGHHSSAAAIEEFLREITPKKED